MEFDVGILRQETRQTGHQEMARQPPLHVDAQQALGLGAAESTFGILDIGEDRKAAAVMGLAIGGRADLPCGPLQQPHAQAPLQLFHRIRDGRGGKAEIMGGGAETAAFYDAGENPHGIQTVHYAEYPNSVRE